MIVVILKELNDDTNKHLNEYQHKQLNKIMKTIQDMKADLNKDIEYLRKSQKLEKLRKFNKEL